MSQLFQVLGFTPTLGQNRDATITPNSYLQLRWSLNQSCSSLQELSNGVLHYTCTYRDWVNSWLLMVGSETNSLTLNPSFDHNLCCKCPNDSRDAILDNYTLRPFQRFKEHFNARCFDPCNQALSFKSPGGLQVPTFGSVSFILASKWGCDKKDYRYWSNNCIKKSLNELDELISYDIIQRS